MRNITYILAGSLLLCASLAVPVQAQSLRDHIMKDLNDPSRPAPPTEAESARDRMQENTTQPQQEQKPTQTQRYNDARQRMQDQEFTADQRQRMMQKMIRRDLVLATGEEPFFEPVKYKRIPPAGSLTERVERLVQGISIDVPPEYDPYGHEVRRYMASIGGPDVFNSKEAMQEQIANIKKAEIIMDYWIKEFRKEVKAIEAEIEERNAPSSTRTSFKYNRGVADAFYAEAFTWAKNNRELLETIAKVNEDDYEISWPTITFKDKDKFNQFKALLEARNEALTQIQEYTPFRVMIY